MMILISGLTGCFVTTSIYNGVQFENVDLTAPGYSGVKYYDINHIEEFKNSYIQDFKYQNSGQWFVYPAKVTTKLNL